MNRVERTLGIILASAFQLACTQKQAVIPVANSERAAVTWGKGDDIHRLCLEYSTAVAQTGKDKFGLSVPIQAPAGGIISPSVNFERDTNIAQIYNVSETLQLGHAALYRLCEARGNGDITTRAEYSELFKDVFGKIRNLIEAQVDVRNYSIIRRRMEAVQKLAELRQKLANLEESHADLLRDLDRSCSGEQVWQLLQRHFPIFSESPHPVLETLEAELGKLDTPGASTCLQALQQNKKQLQDTQSDIEETRKSLRDEDSRLSGFDMALRSLFEHDTESEPPAPPKVGFVSCAVRDEKGVISKVNLKKDGAPEESYPRDTIMKMLLSEKWIIYAFPRQDSRLPTSVHIHDERWIRADKNRIGMDDLGHTPECKRSPEAGQARNANKDIDSSWAP